MPNAVLKSRKNPDLFYDAYSGWSLRIRLYNINMPYVELVSYPSVLL